jgi:hypothetical protein
VIAARFCSSLGISLSRSPQEKAVAAYRAALEEWTRARVPLDWAQTQNNLGTALATLATLGERESGTARLEEAVAAYRAKALAPRPCPGPCPSAGPRRRPPWRHAGSGLIRGLDHRNLKTTKYFNDRWRMR